MTGGAAAALRGNRDIELEGFQLRLVTRKLSWKSHGIRGMLVILTVEFLYFKHLDESIWQAKRDTWIQMDGVAGGYIEPASTGLLHFVFDKNTYSW